MLIANLKINIFHGLFIMFGAYWLWSFGLEAQDLAYGEYLAGECTACHADEGSAIPALFGMDSEYFIEAMQEYSSGLRDNPTMQTVARSLGQEELEALAAWFAAGN